MTWYMNGEVFDPTEDFLQDYVGFVYCITDKESGKKYVGKKFFWTVRKLPPLKGKTRKRTKRTQSDWQKYFGSNEQLKLLVEERGAEAYDREILRLCTTKGQCSYYETKAQFDRDVLLRDDYFNEFIGCKIHSKHLS